jgi:hypothetical protein
MEPLPVPAQGAFYPPLPSINGELASAAPVGGNTYAQRLPPPQDVTADPVVSPAAHWQISAP